MFDIIKNVILAGGYKLEQIQHKVQKLYVIGSLSEQQMDELLAMAAAGVSTESERPGVTISLQAINERLTACEARLAVLEGAQPGAEKYEKWVLWDGVSDKYQTGAIVTHNGKLWESTFGGQNVWEPGALGTESLWKVYTVKE